MLRSAPLNYVTIYTNPPPVFFGLKLVRIAYGVLKNQQAYDPNYGPAA